MDYKKFLKEKKTKKKKKPIIFTKKTRKNNQYGSGKHNIDDYSYSIYGDNVIKFDSEDDATRFNSEFYSNRKKKHIITTLTSWGEVNEYIISKYNLLNVTKYIYKPIKGSNIYLNNNDIKFQFFSKFKQSIYRNIDNDTYINTLRYIFYHTRSGIFIYIKNNKVEMFVPFVNKNYRNTWGDISLNQKYNNLQEYYGDKRSYIRENILVDMYTWWSNANVVSNVLIPEIIGDGHLIALKDMLVELCSTRDIPDVCFFINRRDYPFLRKNNTEPYYFMYENLNHQLTRESYNKYVPILSYYVSDKFADIPIPLSSDWEMVSNYIYPPNTKNNYQITSDIKPWEERIPTAFFRGSGTGGGTNVENNQRLKLSELSKLWETNNKYNSDNKIDGIQFLDAGIVSWNFRDKKLLNSGMYFTHPSEQIFTLVDRVPMTEQYMYKYIVYVEGHSAANRYAFLMKMCVLILKVESSVEAKDMWFFPLLIPYEDYVPVKSDLSDLGDIIRWCKLNDGTCKQIAFNAKNKYERYLNKDGILDYWELLLHNLSLCKLELPEKTDKCPAHSKLKSKCVPLTCAYVDYMGNFYKKPIPEYFE